MFVVICYSIQHFFIFSAAPIIERPPPPLVTLDIGSTFNISCSAVGVSQESGLVPMFSSSE